MTAGGCSGKRKERTLSPTQMMMRELLSIELFKQDLVKHKRLSSWMDLAETQRDDYREKAGLIAVGSIGSAYRLLPDD